MMITARLISLTCTNTETLVGSGVAGVVGFDVGIGVGIGNGIGIVTRIAFGSADGVDIGIIVVIVIGIVVGIVASIMIAVNVSSYMPEDANCPLRQSCGAGTHQGYKAQHPRCSQGRTTVGASSSGSTSCPQPPCR